MEPWLLLLIAFLPLLGIFLLSNNKKSSKKGKNPVPGPPGLPWIGNMHQFESGNPEIFLHKLAKKYGPIFSLKMGKLNMVVLSSAEVVREALKDHDITFSGRPSLTCTQKLSYGGLDIGFAKYGPYWREMRKVMVLELLSMKKILSFRPVHEEEMVHLMENISKLISSNELVNLRTNMISLTSRITCRIAFGMSGDVARGEHKRSADEILTDTEHLLGGFFISDYLPSLGWLDNIRGVMRGLEKNYQELDSFYQDLIEEHLDPNRPESQKNNILDMLLQIKKDQSSLVDLTHNHIKAILTNIFIAATDSSAASAIWAMTFIMKNPRVLKRLQAEVRELFANKTKIDADQLSQIPYLTAVVKEAMRLHIPVPLLLPRETIAGCKIAGYDIEPDTFIMINAWAIAMDPKTWENPNEFRPERFLENDVDVVKGQGYELLPFGSGRRGCPGASLAMVTVELVVANLLNFFDWELPKGMSVDDIDTEGLPGLTSLPKNPLCLVAKKHVF